MPQSAEAERVFLVSYDIADDRRRSRLARLLEAHGQRVQWSVFEIIATPADMHGVLDLVVQSADCFDASEDSLRAYPLCARCRDGVSIFGNSSALPRPGRAIVL